MYRIAILYIDSLHVMVGAFSCAFTHAQAFVLANDHTLAHLLESALPRKFEVKSRLKSALLRFESKEPMCGDDRRDQVGVSLHSTGCTGLIPDPEL